MSEKQVKFTLEGQDTEYVLPAKEFNAYIAKLSTAARAKVQLKGKHDAVYQNTRGDLAREILDGEQVMARASMGRDTLVTGAQDQKLQAYNRQQQERARKQAALNESVLTVASAVAPVEGLARRLYGDNVDGVNIGQAFDELQTTNQPEYMGGMFGMAFGMGGLVSGALKGLGVPFAGARGLAAHAVADEVAFETARYGKYLFDHRKDFQAEEYSQNIITGLMFATPVVGGALLRRPVLRAAKTMGIAGRGGIGLARDALVLKGLKSGNREAMGQAAGLGVLERIMRRGRKTVTKVDELAEMRKAMAKEEAAIGRATPEKLRNAKGGKAEEILDAVRKNMDEGAQVLDDLDVNGMARKLEDVRSGQRKLVQQVLTVNKTMSGKMVRGVGNLGKSQLSALESSMDTFLGRAEAMGYEDMVSPMRGVQGHKQYAQLFKTRLDLMLKEVIGNHRTGILGDELKAISEDPRIWGTGKMAEQSRNINDAVDQLVDGFRDLRKYDIPDDLSKLPDTFDISGLDDVVAKIREGKDRMHASKVLTTSQVDQIEKQLNAIEMALVDGKKAAWDAAKLNKARRSAAITHKKRYEALKSGELETPEGLHGRMQSRMEQAGEELMGLFEVVGKVLDDPRFILGTNRMQRAIREVAYRDKEELFLHMQEKIPMLTGNPEYMARELEPYTADAPEDPALATQASVSTNNTIYFLANKLGRIDRTFYGRNRRPSRTKVNSFFEAFVATQSPIDVAYAAVAGQVTQDMIDAVRVTAPAMYAESSMILMEALDQVEDINKLPRETVKGINKYIGGADPIFRGDVIMQLQSNYAQNQEQHNAITGPGQAPQGKFTQDHPQDGDNAFTFTQRIQSY